MARQERAIRTRQAILIAAAQVFDEVGYEAATISQILQKSGVTKGALYFHYASKEEIAQEVLAQQVDSLPVVPPQELKLQDAVDQALLLAYLLKKDTGDPIVQGGVRLTVDRGSVKDGLDRRAPMRQWTHHTLELFEQAKESGEVLPHVDVARIAELSVGAFTGVQLLSNIMSDREDLVERVADLYMYLLTAIAAPGALARLDFAPERAVRTYGAAMKLRQEQGEKVPELN
ncbi:ScbR family autoregulator-binding transcription factor [Streptomyces sp. NPDC002888]|uniref:ScbR family autoregulator-binding transcription factor n=1 Tax=Streptomyces sp. NPDC002888 TaxID=3364668 RepID=UPI0036A243BF